MSKSITLSITIKGLLFTLILLMPMDMLPNLVHKNENKTSKVGKRRKGYRIKSQTIYYILRSVEKYVQSN